MSDIALFELHSLHKVAKETLIFSIESFSICPCWRGEVSIGACGWYSERHFPRGKEKNRQWCYQAPSGPQGDGNKTLLTFIPTDLTPPPQSKQDRGTKSIFGGKTHGGYRKLFLALHQTDLQKHWQAEAWDQNLCLCQMRVVGLHLLKPGPLRGWSHPPHSPPRDTLLKKTLLTFSLSSQALHLQDLFQEVVLFRTVHPLLVTVNSVVLRQRGCPGLRSH